MSTTERRQRIIEIAHNVQSELHWSAWKDRYPGASQRALPKIRDIFAEEIYNGGSTADHAAK